MAFIPVGESLHQLAPACDPIPLVTLVPLILSLGRILLGPQPELIPAVLFGSIEGVQVMDLVALRAQ